MPVVPLFLNPLAVLPLSAPLTLLLAVPSRGGTAKLDYLFVGVFFSPSFPPLMPVLRGEGRWRCGLLRRCGQLHHVRFPSLSFAFLWVLAMAAAVLATNSPLGVSGCRFQLFRKGDGL